MQPIDFLLRVVVLPGVVCAAAALLGWVVGRRSTRGRDAIVGTGIACGFLASMFASGMGPSFPLAASDNGWHWVVWIAAGGAVLGAAEAFVRAQFLVRLLVRGAACLGSIWLVADPVGGNGFGPGFDFRPSPNSDLLRPSHLIALSALGLWSALAQARPVAFRAAHAAPLLVALAVTAILLAFYGHSYTMAMSTGALLVCVAVTAALGALRRESVVLPPATAAVIAPTFACLVASGLLYLNYGRVVDFPLASALLLIASASGGALRSWKLGLALSIVLAGGAVVVAAVNDAGSGPNAYGWG